MSVRYTVDQQHTDNQYKELSVKPNLSLAHDNINTRTSLANTGIGPAEIKRAALQFDDVCVDSKSVETSQWKIVISFALPKLEKFIFGAIIDDMKRQNASSFGQVAIVSPGDLISAGSSINLISWGALTGSDSEPATAERSEAAARISDSYSKQIRKLSLQIEYCSLTGKFCSKIATKDIGC